MNGELPDGWKIINLENITQINPRHPRDLDDSLPVTFVPMPALNEHEYRFKFQEERPLGMVRKGYTHFAEGDVLFAKITPCMENGKAAIAFGLRNGLGCGTTELHIFRPKEGIDSKYLYFFVHQESFRRNAVQNFTGTAGQLRVPVSFVAKAEIPLPPIAEQRRIVSKLEKLLEKVESCRTRLENIPVLLKRFRQSVLAAACSGRLTADWRDENIGDNNLTETWLLQPLSDLSILITKGASPKWQGVEYTDRGVLFVTSENVGTGKMIFEGKSKYVEPKINEIQPRSILRKGDLLTNIVGASIGRSAIFESDEFANINQAVALVRLNESVNKKYILLVLNSPILIDHMHTEKVDVARANLNLADVANFPIPVPPLSEQHEIVRRVEELFALADRIEVRYQKAKDQVDKLTQSILAKAFRGELVPQDPNDEPASELLTRINAQKGAGSHSKSIKKNTGINRSRVFWHSERVIS
jgi:type I restriction enzyme S subunit